MDLENQMSNKAQGLLLVASTRQAEYKGNAKKKKYVSGLLCMWNMYSTERRKLMTLILQMLFCKKLLAADWDQHFSLVTSKESNQKNQNNDRPFFCHGQNHHHVLEHLVRKKCMNF
jgi:hypothetical protein